MSKRSFTLTEAIDYLDNIGVSADDSDSGDYINFQSEKIFIQPPANAHDDNRDIDFGDENLPTGDASVGSGN